MLVSRRGGKSSWRLVVVLVGRGGGDGDGGGRGGGVGGHRGCDGGYCRHHCGCSALVAGGGDGYSRSLYRKLRNGRKT